VTHPAIEGSRGSMGSAVGGGMAVAPPRPRVAGRQVWRWRFAGN
jgi:hypothetical protein